MDNNSTDVLQSIDGILDDIKNILNKHTSKTTTPWNRLDAFEYKHNLFPHLEECLKINYGIPMKDLMTKEELMLVEAILFEQSIEEVTVLLNENQKIFEKILNRTVKCTK